MRKKIFGLIFILLISISVNAKEIDELFNEVAPDDVFTINAYKPKGARVDSDGNSWYPELDFYPTNLLRMKYQDNNYYGYLDECNEDLTECTLDINIQGDEIISDKRKVKLIWKENNKESQDIINEYVENISNSKVKNDSGFSIYYITDTDWLDYMNDLDKKGKNIQAIDYSSEFKEKISDSNLTYFLDVRMGDDYEMYDFAGGVLVLMQDNVMGGLASVAYQFKNVVLIPNDTENTPDAYMKEAEKRIKEYLNRDDIKIEMVGKRSDLDPETHDEYFKFSLLGNEDKMGDYYYRLTIGNVSDLFVIERNEKIISKFEEEFNKIAPNNKLDLKAYKPDDFNMGKGDFYAESYLRNNFPEESYSITFNSCNSDVTTCLISVNINEEEKEKEVSMVWKDADDGLNKIKDAVAKLKENSDGINEGDEMYMYDIEDMDIVNYLILESSEQCSIPDQVFRSSRKIKEVFNDNKLSFTFHGRLGSGTSFAYIIGGGLVINYDGVIGAHIDVAARIKNVIYVPDDMEDNDELVINYIKKRIGNDKVKVEVVGKRSDYVSEEDIPEYDFSNIGDESKMLDNYYKLSMIDAGGLQNYKYFVVIKDSSKISPVEEESNEIIVEDKETNVTVVTTSDEVPTDAELKVEVVDDKKEEYKEIKKIFKENRFKAFNISLNSKKHGPITKLNNGKFKVTVPLGIEFIGKKIIAYFISDKTIEKYSVIMDNLGNATFETPHFSTYILAEEMNIEENLPDVKEEEVVPKENNTNNSTSQETEEVPKTYDGIIDYIVLLIISTISITFILKRKFN